MTREQNFTTSFSAQLVLYSSWKYLPVLEVKKLPLDEFPMFSLRPGKTTYTKFDPAGKVISGEQDFQIAVSYILPHFGDDTILRHSDIVNLIEQFINNPVYSPPTISFGDTCCIGRCMITDVKAPLVNYEETRFQVIVNAKYVFTIF